MTAFEFAVLTIAAAVILSAIVDLLADWWLR